MITEIKYVIIGILIIICFIVVKKGFKEKKRKEWRRRWKMIEHKFFDLSRYKNIDDAVLELDKLSNYEGWLIVCSVGKRNDKLLLRRMLEYPQEFHSQPVVKEKGKKQSTKMFPNAIYK